MKLITTIAPRRDGVVRATGPDGTAWVFERDADGDLSCDVTDDAAVAALLMTENFHPANPDDFDAALRLAEEARGPSEAPDEDEDDDEVVDALPVEANTPPVPVRAAKGGRASRAAR